MHDVGAGVADQSVLVDRARDVADVAEDVASGRRVRCDRVGLAVTRGGGAAIRRAGAGRQIDVHRPGAVGVRRGCVRGVERSANQRVVAEAANQHVFGRVRAGERRAGQSVIAGAAVKRVAVDRAYARVGCGCHRVVAVAALHDVLGADRDRGHRAARHGVVALAAVERVVAPAAGEAVIAEIANQQRIAGSGCERIVARAAVQHVLAARADQRVVAVAAEQAVNDRGGG